MSCVSMLSSLVPSQFFDVARAGVTPSFSMLHERGPLPVFRCCTSGGHSQFFNVARAGVAPSFSMLHERGSLPVFRCCTSGGHSQFFNVACSCNIEKLGVAWDEAIYLLSETFSIFYCRELIATTGLGHFSTKRMY